MTDNCYRIYSPVKCKEQYVVFSQGLQDKLAENFWLNVTRNKLDERWKIVGKAQLGLTEKILGELDYLSAFVSIPLFSERFVVALKDVLREDVDFFPCSVISNSGKRHLFYIARIHTFLDLIDHKSTDLGQKLSPLSPVIFKSDNHNFLLARDMTKKSTLFASEKLKSIVTKMKFEIGFSSVETSLMPWLNKQPESFKEKYFEQLAIAGRD
jgi:hypothetical protein